jgi:hypothetical protein
MHNVCGREQWAACTCDAGRHILGKLQVLGLEERVETWLQVDEGRSCDGNAWKKKRKVRVRDGVFEHARDYT